MPTLSRPYSIFQHPSTRFLPIIALLFLALTCGLTGCGTQSSTPPPPTAQPSNTLTTLQVSPGTPSVQVGANQQFSAVGTFSDGSHQDMTAAVAWSVSKPSVATISHAGLATSVNIGRTVVTAQSGSVNASTTLIVVQGNATTKPRFAYVANDGDQTISMYTVNATTGQLRHNGYVLAGPGLFSLTVEAGGRFLNVDIKQN